MFNKIMRDISINVFSKQLMFSQKLFRRNNLGVGGLLLPLDYRLKRRGIEWPAVRIDVGIALRNTDHINPGHSTFKYTGRKGFKTNGILEKQGCYTMKLYDKTNTNWDGVNHMDQLSTT